jgi:hypothetical protein
MLSAIVMGKTQAQPVCVLAGVRSEISAEELVRWAEERPLIAICGKEKVTLLSFEFTLFTRKPLQSITFGMGDSQGVPIRAYEALKALKAGDTVILKNITAQKSDGSTFPVEVISMVVAAEAATKGKKD